MRKIQKSKRNNKAKKNKKNTTENLIIQESNNIK
jgi:hypothetical protein